MGTGNNRIFFVDKGGAYSRGGALNRGRALNIKRYID